MKIFFLSLLVFSFTLIIGCSNEPPSVCVKNERTSKANVQFKPASGNTFNINDVEAGAATGYREISEGSYEVSATMQNSPDSPTGGFSASQNFNYTVVILNTKPASMRVDSEEK